MFDSTFTTFQLLIYVVWAYGMINHLNSKLDKILKELKRENDAG